eukprot:148183-Rhodomonas_salina.1
MCGTDIECALGLLVRDAMWGAEICYAFVDSVGYVVCGSERACAASRRVRASMAGGRRGREEKTRSEGGGMGTREGEGLRVGRGARGRERRRGSERDGWQR